MALMNNIRSNTHVILWILILAFVGLIVFEWGASFSFSGGGQRQPQNIAVINGEKITPQEYFQILENQYASAREQSGGSLTEQQRDQIQQQLWEQLVTETLVQQAVEDHNIIITDQDIMRELRTNPPEMLQSVEAFQTDGSFDRQKYLDALNNPVGDEWITIENYVRASLPGLKLQSTALATVTVHESEIREEYSRENVEYSIEYLFVPSNGISDEAAQPSEQAIRQYYQDHLEEYQVPEQRSLEYVVFSKTPSQADSIAARDVAMDALEEARAGADFAELAREYSDGPSASEGGDLGWFGRGQMVAPFEQAAFNAEPGSVVGPVQTQFGYHVIYVRDTRTQNGEEQILASHILINVEVSPVTLDERSSEANLFLFDAQDYGFQFSADTHNVTIQQTPLFERETSFIPGLAPVSAAEDFAFSNPVGTISDVQDVESGYYIFRVSEIRDPYVQPLENVRAQIASTLASQNKREIAYQHAREIYASVSGSTLEAIAQNDSLVSYQSPDPFTIAGSIPGIGQSPVFKGAIKALQVGTISPPVDTDRGSYIILLNEKSEFDEENYEQQKVQIQQRLLTTKQNQFMTRWIASLREEANIVDNRDAFM